MHSYLRCVFLFVLLCAGVVACIPNRKVVYLQDKSKKDPQDFPNALTVPLAYQEYKLQPEDVLSVQISKLPTIDRISADPIEITNSSRTQILHPYLTGLPIDYRGRIDIPTLGEVEVGGLTIDQAQQKINKTASESYSLPSVRVFLLNFNITVLGEVNHPGRYPVYNSRVNVLEALGMAGDCSDFANKYMVKVLRTEAGKNRIFFVDLTDDKLLNSETFFLHPNDVVMVAPLKSKKFANKGSQALIGFMSAIAVVTTLLITLYRK